MQRPFASWLVLEGGLGVFWAVDSVRSSLGLGCALRARLFQLRSAHFVVRTSYCAFRIAHFVLRPSYFALCTSRCVLRAAYFVLRTSYCVLRSKSTVPDPYPLPNRAHGKRCPCRVWGCGSTRNPLTINSSLALRFRTSASPRHGKDTVRP